MQSISPYHSQLKIESGAGSRTRGHRAARRTASGIALGTAVLLGWAAAGQAPAFAAEAPVGLGTAAAYSVLGGTTVTNTGPTTLSGDLGVNPGTAITGFPPGLVSGATHEGDAHAGQAQSDLTTAYNDAAGRAMTASVAGDLVGQTLVPGVYKSAGPLAVSGALTLNGQGNPNSVFIFQVASALTTATASNIVLTNSAQACNVYWQVGSSATLGTASTFNGNILALTSITATTGTRVQGRALARNGQVSLDTNVFSAPGCATATPSASPSASATPSASPSASASVSPSATASASPTAVSGPSASPSASAGRVPNSGPGSGADAGTGTDTGTRRGVNIDTAAETTGTGTATALGAAAAATGLLGVWMLAGGRRSFRRTR